MTAGGPEPAAGDGGGEALRAFGRYLHRERELRGLGRDDVARFTKLAPAVIEALEECDPARMPPRAYLFGYLRSYSSAVGLDPDEVVLRYQEAAGPCDPEPAAAAADGAASRLPPRPRRRWIVLAALALLAALAAAFGLWRTPRGAGELRGRRSPERAPYQAPAAP